MVRLVTMYLKIVTKRTIKHLNLKLLKQQGTNCNIDFNLFSTLFLQPHFVKSFQLFCFTVSFKIIKNCLPAHLL